MASSVTLLFTSSSVPLWHCKRLYDYSHSIVLGGFELMS